MPDNFVVCKICKPYFIFTIYVFLPKAKKASIDGLKWRDLVEVGWYVGGGGGGWWLVVSQRVSCVKLRKTFRNHVNVATEASSCAKLFALEIS